MSAVRPANGSLIQWFVVLLFAFTYRRHVKPSREYALRGLLELLRMAFVVAGFFLLGCLLLILGIAIYFWLEEPRRMAADRATFLQVSPTNTKVLLITHTIITPQPLQVSLAETNVMLRDPPLGAYLSGGDTNAEIWVKTNMVLINPSLEAYLSGGDANAAIWANGKAFRSGGRAAWELARGAWRLWLLGAGTLTCGLLLRRYFSAQKPKCELIIHTPEAGASPNGGRAPPVANSGVTEELPSVS